MYEDSKALLESAAEGLREMLPDFGLSKREQNERAEVEASLRLIEHALAKFSKGTYGQCEKCGVVMTDEAMEAVPTRRLCDDCV